MCTSSGHWSLPSNKQSFQAHGPEWCLSWCAGGRSEHRTEVSFSFSRKCYSGCYYYSTGRQDPARRYLEKATKQDVMFGPAWLAYGHSFAVENEHDQAMAAYFKASQLMAALHQAQVQPHQ